MKLNRWFLPAACVGILALGTALAFRPSSPASATPHGASASANANANANANAKPTRSHGNPHTQTPTPTPTTTAPSSTSTPTPTPTTTPTPTSTPTPTPPTTAPAVAWPDASNTGVPPGTVLTPSGSITVNTAGTIIANKDVQGCITINALNVTIKDTRVTAAGCTSGDVIHITSTGALLTDDEVNGSNLGSVTSCIGWGGYTATRVNMHNCSDGARANNNVTIVDSYIHDLYESSTSHNDGIQITEGSHEVFTHNRIENPASQTSAVMIGADQGAISSVNVSGNLFAGGGYCLYGGQGGSYAISGISITNNEFSTKFYPKCGYYGPTTALGSTAITFTGNTWADGPNAGQPVS